QCGPNYVHDGNDGSMWCTNRLRGTSDLLPTTGILNQIGVGLCLGPPADWTSFVQQSPPGQDREAAIDFFRTQFGLSALNNPGSTFFRSNTFYAPFIPVRNIYLFTSFEANDRLVHYTIGDLLDSERTNRVAFTT